MVTYMSKIKTRILIIGAGNIAEQHLKVLSKLINLKNCFICSRTVSKSKILAKKYLIKHVSQNYLDFIKYNKNNIDGIMILVSLDNIFQVSKNVIKYKIPVFIEKPPGTNIKEVKKLSSFSEKYKTSNLVGYNRRYYSIIQKLKKKLKKEKVISAHVEAHERYWILKKKVKDKKFLNRWNYSNTSHVLNLILYLLGDYQKVTAYSKNYFRYPNIEVNSSAIIKFKNNLFTTFKSNWNVAGGWLLKIFGDKNTYIIQPLEKCTIINKKFNKKKIEPENFDKINKSGFYLQLKKFLKIIESKNHYNDLKNIVNTFKLINKIFKN